MERTKARAFGTVTALACFVGLGVPRAIAGTNEAVLWLAGEQMSDGSWAGGLPLRDTSAVLDALNLVAPSHSATFTGRAWLANQAANNFDTAARRIAALAPAGVTNSADGLALVALRNSVEFDTAKPNYPEGGWGIAAGFATDTLDTAVAMDALFATGLNGGFAVYNRASAPATTNTHEWDIPTGTLKVRLLVTVSGSTVRVRMKQGTPPTGADPFFGLPPGTWLIVFPDSGLPFTPGHNFVTVQNVTGVAATYTMTASYETPTFDTRRLVESLDYLRLSQTLAGGWNLQRGGVTNFPVTLHVLRTLQRYSNYRNAAVMDPALIYVRGLQNPDGSFSDGGNTPDYLTALALQVLAAEGVCAVDSVGARAYLAGQQEVNGSWDNDPYSTAVALWGTNPPPPADVNGTVDLGGVSQAVTRTVTFVITDCDDPEGPSTELRNVSVSFNGVGEGTFLLDDVPAAADWISADESHVLRRLVAVNPQECTLNLANFLGGSLLRSGDLNDDQFIDVEDFAILALRWNQAGSQADVTGDGQQNQQDLNAMVPNLFAIGDPLDGCAVLRSEAGGGPLVNMAPDGRGPRTSMLVSELLAVYGDARRADVNADGVIDIEDIAQVARDNNVNLPRSLQRGGMHPQAGDASQKRGLP